MESVFNHTAHKALWNWLSENPQESQLEWIGWKHNGVSMKLMKIQMNVSHVTMLHHRDRVKNVRYYGPKDQRIAVVELIMNVVYILNGAMKPI